MKLPPYIKKNAAQIMVGIIVAVVGSALLYRVSALDDRIWTMTREASVFSGDTRETLASLKAGLANLQTGVDQISEQHHVDIKRIENRIEALADGVRDVGGFVADSLLSKRIGVAVLTTAPYPTRDGFQRRVYLINSNQKIKTTYVVGVSSPSDFAFAAAVGGTMLSSDQSGMVWKHVSKLTKGKVGPLPGYIDAGHSFVTFHNSPAIYDAVQKLVQGRKFRVKVAESEQTPKPFNIGELAKYVRDNEHLFRPPVGNERSE